MFTNNVLNPRLDTFLRVHHRIILDSGEVVDNRGIPVTPRIFFFLGGGGGRVASDGIDGQTFSQMAKWWWPWTRVFQAECTRACGASPLRKHSDVLHCSLVIIMVAELSHNNEVLGVSAKQTYK